jgi:hypothetical protein
LGRKKGKKIGGDTAQEKKTKRKTTEQEIHGTRGSAGHSPKKKHRCVTVKHCKPEQINARNRTPKRRRKGHG